MQDSQIFFIEHLIYVRNVYVKDEILLLKKQ